ncbi:MAG: ParB N-terminal domain-containing protein [Candidatus Methanomethylophilaceae archaeon]|nr:ParB N-terminal domain-containing protein [Candidatus Methanomethylophilaceae archaeon]
MAQHRKLKMVYRSPDDLIPYENNPRLNDDTVPALKDSIEEFDFLVPIVVNKDGTILSGHTRLKAAKELGLKEVPVIVAEHLDDVEGRKFRLVDNKIAESSGWDFELLDVELDDLRVNFDVDLSTFGFDNEEFNMFPGDPEPAAEPVPAPMPSSGKKHDGIAVIVNVSCEEEAEDLVSRLQSEGYDCRVL